VVNVLLNRAKEAVAVAAHSKGGILNRRSPAFRPIADSPVASATAPPSPNPGPPLFSLLGVQGVLELVGGFLMLIGLFTRPVAFILAGDMAVAYFMSHAPRNFFPMLNGGDAAILFCFVFLTLFVAGGGAWSVDAMLGQAGAVRGKPVGGR